MRSSSGEEARAEPSVALITERGGTKCALHRERRHTVPRPITFLIGEMGIPAPSRLCVYRLAHRRACALAPDPTAPARAHRAACTPLHGHAPRARRVGIRLVATDSVRPGGRALSRPAARALAIIVT